MTQERLQKIIAAAGITSRRKAEQLITSGQVSVNGQVVTELGSKADPEHDHIRVGGKLLRGPEHHVYLLLNKPKGFVTTASDPERRPTIMDLLQGLKTRVYPVGRLDYASEGLLLLTNDGELANRLTRAASHVPKTYLVKVSGRPGDEALAKLRSGVVLREPGKPPVKTAPAKIRHHVEKIKRVKYGPLELDVAPGEYRRLEPEEVRKLQVTAGDPRRKTNESVVGS